MTPTISGGRQSDWLVVVCALIGIAATASLGVWQIERLRWKNVLIAKIEARTNAPPVGLDEAVRRMEGGDADYLRVRVRGAFVHEQEVRLFAVEGGAPGWFLITPLATATGPTVLVNRGFVPDKFEQPKSRPGSQPQGEVEITGLVRGSETPGLFTPNNDIDRRRWFWRDVGGMAHATFPSGRAIDDFLIEQEADRDARGMPRPGATRLALSNRHFEYALTWFGLAATLFVVTLFFLRSRRPGSL